MNTKTATNKQPELYNTNIRMSCLSKPRFIVKLSFDVLCAANLCLKTHFVKCTNLTHAWYLCKSSILTSFHGSIFWNGETQLKASFIDLL